MPVDAHLGRMSKSGSQGERIKREYLEAEKLSSTFLVTHGEHLLVSCGEHLLCLAASEQALKALQLNREGRPEEVRRSCGREHGMERKRRPLEITSYVIDGLLFCGVAQEVFGKITSAVRRDRNHPRMLRVVRADEEPIAEITHYAAVDYGPGIEIPVAQSQPVSQLPGSLCADNPLEQAEWFARPARECHRKTLLMLAGRSVKRGISQFGEQLDQLFRSGLIDPHLAETLEY